MSVSSTQAFSALEVGVVLAAVSNGVLALQINRYFRKPGKDPLFMKLLILVIWLTTVAHLFLGASTLYILTITHHGRPIPEVVLPMTYPAGAGLGAFIHSSVQSIYTYRLYKLKGRWPFPVVCWALSTYVLGSGIAYAILKSTELTAALMFATKWNWVFYSHFSVAAGVDILIAASTCWTLMESRDGSHLRRTQRLVNRIMLRTVQTGFATSVVAVAVVIVFAVCQPSTNWLGLYLTLTPLYPMTLLALFNGRVRIKEPKIRTIGISVESHIHFDDEVGMNSKSPAQG